MEELDAKELKEWLDREFQGQNLFVEIDKMVGGGWMVSIT